MEQHAVLQLMADSLLAVLQPVFTWIPKKLPCRLNHCRQPRDACGFYVAWWLEDEIRAASGEGFFVNKYPAEAGIRDKMCRLFQSLESAHKKMLKDLKAEKEERDLAEKLFNEAAAKRAEETGKELETLQELATKKMQEGEFGVPIVFDVEGEEGGLEAWAASMMEHKMLFPKHLKICERVKAADRGVCSHCHFSAGCPRCYWPKTVRYWRSKECREKLMEGYTPAAKAAAKGRAKAAGLPVPAAGGPEAKAKGEAKAKAKAKKMKAAAGAQFWLQQELVALQGTPV